MRILVLGGAGYIGSHTALELVRAGHEVIVADNLLTGHRNAVPKQVKFYEGDIRDAAFLDKLFDAEKIDAVIHFAAFRWWHPVKRQSVCWAGNRSTIAWRRSLPVRGIGIRTTQMDTRSETDDLR